jgi:hypothetical protein
MRNVPAIDDEKTVCNAKAEKRNEVNKQKVNKRTDQDLLQRPSDGSRKSSDESLEKETQ